MQPYAIFLDIDGTLTAAENQVVPANVQAIRAVRARGHRVFINTGRAMANISETLIRAAEVDGVVAGGGAYLRLGTQVLRHARMTRAGIDAAEEIFFENKRLCVFEGEQEMFVLNPRNGVPQGWQLLQAPGDMRTRFPHAAITKCTMGGHLERAGQQRLAGDGYCILHPDYTEMILNGFDKGTGIVEMCRACGISPQHTIAMGDSVNDIGMLRRAGIAVAMGNGMAEIKPLVHYVTTRAHHEGGVAEALTHLLLQGEDA